MTMRIYGWGSELSNSPFSDELQTGSVEYTKKKTCIEQFECTYINPTAVCAGGSTVGSQLQRGDDGTPMILTGGEEDVLIGIGFHESVSGCREGTSQFLRITFFMKWIKSHVPDIEQRNTK